LPCARALKPGANPLADHHPFELSKHPAHLEHGLASRCGGVDALMMQVLIDAFGLQIRMQRDELLQRSS